MNTLLTRSQRDAKTVMWSSIGGAVVSSVFWILTAPTFGFVAVAWGYLVGALVSSFIPFCIVWRQESMRWTAPVLRVALGVAAATVIAVWVHWQHAGVLGQVCAAVGLLLGWLLVSWRDTRAVYTLVPQLLRSMTGRDRSME